MSPSLAQEPGKGVTATVEVTILTLDVLAIDSKERPVLGLSKDDFEVKVGGKVQAIEGFESPGSAETARAGSSQEYIAKTTLPMNPGGPAPLHLLLYIDEEELPSGGATEAARAGLEYARTPEGGPRISLVTHFGAASTRLWDETSLEHMARELQPVATGPSAPSASWVASAGRGSGTVASGAGALNWDQRKRIETALVEEILHAASSNDSGHQLVFPREPTPHPAPGVSDRLKAAQPRDQHETSAANAAYTGFAEYLRNERIRVRDSIRELRTVSERFALLGGRRHVVLFSQGYERTPGMNAVRYLTAALAANGRAGTSPGATRTVTDGRLAFNDAPVKDFDDLEAWLAASGVTMHFIDPSRGAEMITAEDDPVAVTRDRRGDLFNTHDGGTRLADATGGLIRLLPSDLGDTLGGVATAAARTYRIAVRLSNVDIAKPYKIQVAVRKSGVRARARRTFVAEDPKLQRAGNSALVDQALQSVSRSGAEEKLPGAARHTPKPISVTASWKGKTGPDPFVSEQRLYGLEVTIPYDDMGFKPEEDSMLASLKVFIKAASKDSQWNETSSEDIFVSLTGPEYSAAAGRTFVKTITLSLPPGRHDLTISVNDVLENSFGTARLQVEAEK